MGTVDLKFGTLIRTGPNLAYGGKWDADLVDWKIDAFTNAYLTIFIRIFFAKIDPAGKTGTYGDTDDTAAKPSKKPIQKWKPGEFEWYVRNLTSSAQAFWDGQFWLKTPKTYDGLNYIARGRPANRCNIYCKLDLKGGLRGQRCPLYNCCRSRAGWCRIPLELRPLQPERHQIGEDDSALHSEVLDALP